VAAVQVRLPMFHNAIQGVEYGLRPPVLLTAAGQALCLADGVEAIAHAAVARTEEPLPDCLRTVRPRLENAVAERVVFPMHAVAVRIGLRCRKASCLVPVKGCLVSQRIGAGYAETSVRAPLMGDNAIRLARCAH